MQGFYRLSHNGKGLCEGGAKKAETFYKHEPEQKPFRFCKITKNKKTKWFFAAKMRKSSTQEKFNPAFAKPLLPAVSFLISNFHSKIFCIFTENYLI